MRSIQKLTIWSGCSSYLFSFERYSPGVKYSQALTYNECLFYWSMSCYFSLTLMIKLQFFHENSCCYEGRCGRAAWADSILICVSLSRSDVVSYCCFCSGRHFLSAILNMYFENVVSPPSTFYRPVVSPSLHQLSQQQNLQYCRRSMCRRKQAVSVQSTTHGWKLWPRQPPHLLSHSNKYTVVYIATQRHASRFSSTNVLFWRTGSRLPCSPYELETVIRYIVTFLWKWDPKAQPQRQTWLAHHSVFVF